jgi:hypothetical protein
VPRSLRPLYGGAHSHPAPSALAGNTAPCRKHRSSCVPHVQLLRQPLDLLGDITERKLAAEALKVSEEKFAALFHCSAVSMTVSDHQ